ncbi:MAG: hypothetical protein U9Q76_07725 [candidate division WOR-3 bacterium]|nr:hypothetical protein [candidate division WOR-3 bacterium]
MIGIIIWSLIVISLVVSTIFWVRSLTTTQKAKKELIQDLNQKIEEAQEWALKDLEKVRKAVADSQLKMKEIQSQEFKPRTRRLFEEALNDIIRSREQVKYKTPLITSEASLTAMQLKVAKALLEKKVTLGELLTEEIIEVPVASLDYFLVDLPCEKELNIRGRFKEESTFLDSSISINDLYYATNCVSCLPSSRSGCLIIDNF